MVAPAGWSRFSGLRAPFSGALRPWHGLNCSTARQAESGESDRSSSQASPPPHSELTETFGGPITPLGAASLPIMAGENGTTRQHEALVTDVLHGCPYRKLGAGYEASAVFHVPWVMAGCHCGWRGKQGLFSVWGTAQEECFSACRKHWV